MYIMHFIIVAILSVQLSSIQYIRSVVQSSRSSISRIFSFFQNWNAVPIK